MRDKYEFTPVVGLAGAAQVAANWVSTIFDQDKILRKLRSILNETELAAALHHLQANALQANAPPANAHPALHAHEKRYLTAGGDWGALRLRLQGLVWPPPPAAALVTLQVVPVNLTSFRVDATIRGTAHHIGDVHLGDQRFVAAPAAPALIFQRRAHPGREYVHVPHSNSYVKRYVIRGISAFDAMNLDAGRPLKAAVDPLGPNATSALANETGHGKHTVAAGGVLTEQQQILSHTRGWAKRYISVGVSRRDVFSTRGTQFNSLYGVVLIDLQQVPAATIFDVHRPDLAAANVAPALVGPPALGGLPALTAADIQNNPDHLPAPALPLQQQRYLALRDVLRTRELLIKGEIPLAAVIRVQGPADILGLGSKGPQGGHLHAGAQAKIVAATAPANITAHEHTRFKEGYTERRWHFTKFVDAASCAAAELALAGVTRTHANPVDAAMYKGVGVGVPPQISKLIHSYTLPPNPPGF